MNEVIINVGPLRDINSLIYYLIPQLKNLRNNLSHGLNPEIKYSFLEVGRTKENPYQFKSRVDALTCLLSITKKLRDSFGYRIPTVLTWRREIFGFWDDIGFLKIANKFDLFEWDYDFLGGYDTGNTNPDSRIIYFDDIPFFSPNTDKVEVDNWKSVSRQTFKRRLLLEFSPIIDSIYFEKDWTKELIDIFAITCSELIVNTLLHGQDLAFVGFQRTSDGFTVSVCDSGPGFKDSLLKDYKWNKHSWLRGSNLTHLQYAIISTMVNTETLGLYDAINDVIISGGWVIISTFNTEIRIEKELWNFMISEYLDTITDKKIPNFKTLERFKKEGFLRRDEYKKGHYQLYNGFMKGVRFSFHVPFNKP